MYNIKYISFFALLFPELIYVNLKTFAVFSV